MSDSERSTTAGGGPADDQRWNRALIEKLATDSLVERRRSRRWSIFFRMLYLAFAIFGLVVAIGILGADRLALVGPHVAVIDVRGAIEEGGSTSAERINGALAAAFEESAVSGLILRINSPGGSPVQAGQIHDEIRRLRARHPDKPLFAVVEEVCASGGYYVAAAADRIFVDKASLVGSIGVLIDGFGFAGAIDRLGIERRLLTAGANKGFLDPFSPIDETHRLHAQKMLDEIHQQFITAVREGRGDRLPERPELYSGLVWTGARAVDLGLADGIGTVRSVARAELSADTLIDYTPRESVTERIAKQVGARVAAAVAAGIGAGADAVGAPRLR